MLELITIITDFVKDTGYLGIFIMTFLESTFIPIPAEITMVPAGYLVDQGELDMLLVMVCSILGTLGGAWFNYFIAAKYGSSLIINYGKYFFMDEKRIKKLEEYYKKHGNVATFTGRLIPGLRHYISFPAGLARMKLKLFLLYTALGGGIWMFILLMLGYVIGENQVLIKEYLATIQLILFLLITLFLLWYYFKIFKRRESTRIVNQDKTE
jgi:membrane protein DedA with SNARE-associated domain